MTDEESELFNRLADEIGDDAEPYTPPAVRAAIVLIGIIIPAGGIMALVAMSWRILVGTVFLLIGVAIVASALGANQISRRKARRHQRRHGPWPEA